MCQSWKGRNLTSEVSCDDHLELMEMRDGDASAAEERSAVQMLKYGTPSRTMPSREYGRTSRRNPDSRLPLELAKDEPSTIAKYRKNQIVFSQGDAAGAVYRIQKGKVRVTVVSDRGKEAVLALLGPDDFFGEDCIAGLAKRTSTACASTDSAIVRIPKSEMVRLLHQRTVFSDMFVDYILTRTIRVQADLVDQLFNSSERRLARLFLLLANYGQDGKTTPIIEKISQETLAEMIGTTRSRVSHFMNKFRKLGFISYDGYNCHIEVHRSLLNSVLQEKPHIEI